MSPPLIIPVFISQRGCPHRCAFCDQIGMTGIEPSYLEKGRVRSIVHRSVASAGKKRHRVRQLAFYGGNFCGLSPVEQQRLLSVGKEFIREGSIDSLRISTRPDSLDTSTVQRLSNFGVKTIEIGAQSMVDDVLIMSRRGHTSEDVVLAMEILKAESLEAGIHLMVGLPGDDEQGALGSATKILELRPHFVRIHPTLVIANTPLAALFRMGLYAPMSLEEAIRVCKRLYLIFKKARIPLIRMGLQPTVPLQRPGKIVAGPYHPAFRQLIESAIFLDMARTLLEDSSGSGTREFRVSPKDESSFRGQRNENLVTLRQEHPLDSIEVYPDVRLSRGTLAVRCGSMISNISMEELET